MKPYEPEDRGWITVVQAAFEIAVLFLAVVGFFLFLGLDGVHWTPVR